jgi:hypothetical protein
VVSQAIEQSALLAPVTKWVARVERSASFDDVFSHALRVATTGRPGPVALEIPEDVFSEPLAEGHLTVTHEDAAFPRFRPALTASDVTRISALLAEAERPLLLAGGGVLASGACDALLDFADTTGIPVATTIMGKGAIDEPHVLSLGVVGTFGCVRAGAALIEADAVLVIGSKLDQVSTIGFRMPRAGQRLVHLDKKKGMGRQGPWPGGYFSGRPSEILKEHLYLTPYPEDDVLPLVELMGAEHVLFGSDYPHPEGLADPNAFVHLLEGLDASAIRRVMATNTLELLGAAT